MATDPEPHPLDEALDHEVAGIFDADPDFRSSLLRTVERTKRGEEPLIDHAEVVRRMRELGLPVEDDPAPPSS